MQGRARPLDATALSLDYGKNLRLELVSAMLDLSLSSSS
jgi:hypothetical protein